MSLDGFVAGPNGEMDWLVWNWDEELKSYVGAITESIDCILLGRTLAQGFIPVWASRAENAEAEDGEFAQKMVNLPKVVFSNSLDKPEWENVTLASGNVVEEVNRLKQQPGNDLMLYGGASLVASFIQHNLIDEYNLFVNPVILGKGMPIFSELDSRLNLKLINSQSFSCGIVAVRYEPNRN